MTQPDFPTPDELIAPVCRATVDRLQLVLDGDLEASALDADPHPADCAACRQRINAARLVLSVLATSEPAAAPAGLTDNILAAVKDDRFARIRRRSYAVSVGVLVTLAASVFLLTWLFKAPQQNDIVFVDKHPPSILTAPEVAPEPRTVPAVKPLRIGDELSKAGLALRETPRAITDPASAAPDMLAKLTDALTRPVAEPDDMAPVSNALAELPEIARTGLEPITGTAQKAFAKLMRDVGTVSVKPKS